MKPKRLNLFLLFVLCSLLFCLASCSDTTGSTDLSLLALLGGGKGFDINKLSAGLYLGAPEDLTSASVPIDTVTVPANDLAAAVTHVTNASNPDGAYTLLISQDVSAGKQNLNRANCELTIIGIGKERTIQFNGANNEPMFNLEASGASLSLGNNITLKGKETSTLNVVRVANGAFFMHAGSKITGHITTDSYGAVAVYGANASFTMKGGSITGNQTSSSVASTASGGLYVGSSGTFTMTGGSIIGNTRNTTPPEMDVILLGPDSIANSSKTGGTIGTSIPATLATKPIYP